MSTTTRQRKPGFWYPWMFVGMFTVVIAVNGALAYFATSTFTGLHTEGAYEKGLAYNDALAGAAAQEKLGWVVRADLVAAAPAEGRHGGVLSVDVHGPDGIALDGIDVFAVFTRPTVAGHDTRVPLTRAANDTFVSNVELPFSGQWDMQVVANRGGESFQLNQRVMLP